MVDPACGESALVERIAELERVKSAAAAGQARAAAALDAARRAAEAAAGVPAARRGRGVASEIALARRDSPARGNRHLGFAKALVHEMPHTLAALEAGVLTEWRATLIVRESACLDVEDRRTLDAELCADPAGLDGMGDARVAAAAKTIAYRLDPHAVVDRAAKAETERTVTIRPAPDTMTYLTALLPVAQGVSVYAALRREADICDRRALTWPGHGRHAGRAGHRPTARRRRRRSRSTWWCRTKRCWADANTPADICGYGPDPGGRRPRIGLRRRHRCTVAGHAAPALRSPGLRGAGGNGVTGPAVSPRVGRLHRATGSACRTPYCDAPIRHRDHARPWARGGTTSAGNGLG